MTQASKQQAEFRKEIGQEFNSTDAYYFGRNSIGDGNEVWYRLDDCPEINSPVLVAAFLRGVRDVRAENRLNADTEWDAA